MTPVRETKGEGSDADDDEAPFPETEVLVGAAADKVAGSDEDP